MNTSPSLLKTWVRLGIATGFLATLVYPLLIAVPMPLALTVLLAAAFGPLLSVASLGLYHYLAATRSTVSLQVAVVFNIIAGTLVNTMLVIQLSIREFLSMRLAAADNSRDQELIRLGYSGADKVQLGLDVSWDVYIAMGTFLFALNMLNHPRFGKVIGLAGMLTGVLLLVFNLATFPVPPAESGSIDFGPLAGLWYFAVTVMLLRAYRQSGFDVED